MEPETSNYYGTDLAGLTNIALGKSATQSSQSKWSKPDDPCRAVNGIKTGSYSFHTELEINPWWMIDLESVFPIEKVILFNRDETKNLSARASNLSILASIDSQSWLPIYCAINEFGGFVTKQPLIINCNANVVARYLKIQINGRQILHLDEVEVYVANTALVFKETFGSYVLTMSNSGFGDQLIEMKVSSFLLELLGLQFAGFFADSLLSCGRVSRSREIYEKLGFFTLSYLPSSKEKLIDFEVSLESLNADSIQAFQINLASIIAYIIRRSVTEALSALEQDFKPILNIRFSPKVCDWLIGNSPNYPYNKTSVAIHLQKSCRSSPECIIHESNSEITILLHLRLGDTTVVKLPNEQGYITPFHGVITQTLEEMQVSFSHRYFDIDRLLTFAAEVKEKFKVKLCLATDGFTRARNFLITRRMDLLVKCGIGAAEIEQAIEQQEKDFIDKLHFVDLIAYGETDISFMETFNMVQNADIIISTGGHFIYNLASIFSLKSKSQSLYIRKYGRTLSPIGALKTIRYIEDFDSVEEVFENITQQLHSIRTVKNRGGSF